MEKKFREQYERIRESILRNIETIRSLVATAEGLSELAESMTGSEEQSHKQQLEAKIKTMRESIAMLIDQTQQLFNEYNTFISKVCK